MTRRLLALALVMILSGSAIAESVAIKNYSFEDPVQDPGGWTNDLPDWDGPAAAGDAFIEYIDGFASEGVNHLGIQNLEEVSQDLGVGALPSTTYNLTVGVGNRNIDFTPATGNESRFGLYVGGDAGAGGTLIADDVVDAYLVPEGTFEDFSLSVTTGADVPAGNLFLSLRTTGEGRAHFDNIRLEAVPEPSTLALTLLGLVAMVSRLRRR